MFQKLKTINLTMVMVQLIVHAFLVMAAFISFTDIRTLAVRWGVYASLAWTAPLFIDGLTWMGKLGRSKRLAEKTRKAGLMLMALGGSMSLYANVEVGETKGMKIYGALVVLGYVVAEWYSGQIEGVTKTSDQPKASAWVVTDAEKAARKAAGYAKLDAAAKAAWTMKYRTRIRAQQAKAGQLAASGATTP